MAKVSRKLVRELTSNPKLAAEFIMDRRWGEDRSGFTCQRCDASGATWAAGVYAVRCSQCGTVAGPLAGTIFGRTKIPASEIIWMTWSLASRPNGLSAIEASREMGVSRVSTQRILGLTRHALSEAEVGRQLSGEVEADETFLGGKGRDTNKRGRSETKQCVLVLAERHTGGKCILQHVPDAKARTLLPIIKHGVEKDSDIYTDGHRAYSSLGKLGYKHTEHVIKGSGIRAHVMLPAVHQVAKTLKAQLQGTHKRMPKDELLQDYLGAFQWRYNHRDLEPVDAFLAALDIVLGTDNE